MDSKAEYLSEHISNPFEYLRQLRQTTEPIGGSTEYAEDGELVEYDVAVEAVKKTVDKAATWFANRYQANGSYLNADDIDDFIKTMKRE